MEDDRSYRDSSHRDVNDVIDDGGGCTEAWNAMGELRENSQKTRRAIIKVLGAGAATAAGSGTVSAQPTISESDDTDPEVDYVEVSGDEARKSVATALKSTEMKMLRRKLRDEGSIPSPDDPTVVDIEVEGQKAGRLVNFPLKGVGGATSDEETIASDVAIAIKNDEVEFAKAVIATKDTTVEEEWTVSAQTLNATSEGVQEETNNALVSLNSSPSDGLMAQADDSTECFACTTVADAACTVGCGLGVAIICSGTAVANLGAGLACGAVAGAICSILTATGERYVHASCAADFGMEYACYYAGYCDEPLN